MREIHSKKPHFFQPLLPNFLYNFSIPKSFLENLGDLQNKQEKKAELRDKNGLSWYIKLVILTIRDNSIKLQFKDGWVSFCNDHALQVGDFLVFKYQGNLVFDVFIFAPTACERQIPNPDPMLEKKDKNPCNSIRFKGVTNSKRGEEDRMKGRSSFKSSTYPFCRTVVRCYCLKWHGMPLPREFAEKNGLSKRWCDMELIDEKGCSWPMLLRYRRQRTNGAAYIGRWTNFHKANHLKPGDAVIFQLLKSGQKPIMKFFKAK